MKSLVSATASVFREAASATLIALGVVLFVACVIAIVAAALCYLGFDAAWRRA